MLKLYALVDCMAAWQKGAACQKQTGASLLSDALHCYLHLNHGTRPSYWRTAPKPEEAVRSFSAPMLCTNFPRNSARLSPRPDCLTPTKNLFLEQAAVIAVVPVVLVAIICTRKDELGQRKQLFHCRLLLH
jgi:hypothetical protein